MPPLLRPRAFLSYRHTEHETGASADALNAEHRAWVGTFARDLNLCGVETVHDGDLRDLFAPHSAKDPFTVPFIAEISTITCLICHAFIPILTPSYLDRIGYADYAPQQQARLSYAQEEWQFGCFYSNAGAMQFVPIVRAGDPERMAVLPLGVGPDNGFDMRDPQHYQAQVRFIAQRILAGWDGDYPLIKLSPGEWMAFYIQWCRENYPGCAERKVDEWTVDLLRPRVFLDSVLGKR